MPEPIADRSEYGDAEASIGEEIQEYGRRISRYGEVKTIRELIQCRDESSDDDIDADEYYDAVLRRVRELKNIAERLEKLADDMKHVIY